jgi:hypothetical protein
MSFGFVIVRHVNSTTTNEYWKESYRCIRKFYREKIIIIDDNSDNNFLTTDLPLINCDVIKSEYPARGEILGYYYFHKLHPFDKAIIIHDSVFFNQRLQFDDIEDVKFLWCFKHTWDDDNPTIGIISKLKDYGTLLHNYMNKDKWLGCFGIMSVITWDFINIINERHDFFRIILDTVKCRRDRQHLERIFAVVCYTNKDLPTDPSCSLFGIIHDAQAWGLTYAQYQSVAQNPVTKVFTGR